MERQYITSCQWWPSSKLQTFFPFKCTWQFVHWPKKHNGWMFYLKRKFSWMPAGARTHAHAHAHPFTWSLHFFLLSTLWNRKAFALPSHFTNRSLASAVHLPEVAKATAPGPLCFDQVEANHWSVEQEAVGMAWYGSQEKGSQTVGTAAAAVLAEPFHNQVAVEVLIVFTCKPTH